MFIAMRDLDHKYRLRQMALAAVAAIGIAILALAIASAGSTSAHADETQNLNASDRTDIDRVSAYMSSLTDMEGNFLQVGPDGSLAEGKFYLRRPGRLRFEYTPPEKMLVVADGTWVAVKDGYSATQRYPLGATPLGLLLEEHVDLAKEVKILSVERQPGALRIKLADKSGNAPGDITLVFDEPSLQLRQWVVTDAQGLQTTVALRSIQNGIRANNGLFVIRMEQRPGMRTP
ncbi:MAG: outer membrane lipoprotein carrier protein LolA [Parvibaculum sp.]|nr:outer membrane lipoprotein carrier protein LolA [Parvibaculum sp.]